MNKKIKKANMIYKRNPCPHCNSENVADIKPTNLLIKEDEILYKESLSHDLPVYYVMMEDYRDYYLKNNLNTRCLDCKYEYFSKTEKISRKEIAEPGTPETPEAPKEESPKKKQSKLSRILAIIKE